MTLVSLGQLTFNHFTLIFLQGSRKVRTEDDRTDSLNMIIGFQLQYISILCHVISWCHTNINVYAVMELLCTLDSLAHKTGHTCGHGQGHPMFPSFSSDWVKLVLGYFFMLKKIQAFVIFFKSKKMYIRMLGFGVEMSVEIWVAPWWCTLLHCFVVLNILLTSVRTLMKENCFFTSKGDKKWGGNDGMRVFWQSS